MKFLIQIKIALCKTLEWTLILVMGLLVLTVLWQVFTRSILSDASRWADEAARFLLIWGGLLGASVGFSRKAHLGIDYLVEKLQPLSYRLTGVISCMIVAGFAIYAMIIGGMKVVTSTLATGQVSTALNIPMGYVYLALPISGIFIVFFALENLLELFVGVKSEQVGDNCPDLEPKIGEV